MIWKISSIISFGLFLTLSFYRFLGAGRDDTFIFLWAGETLGQSSWLVNYNMENQEIVSSYLVPIIVKALNAFSPEGTFFTLRVSGIAVTLLSLILLWLFRNRLFSHAPNSSAAIVILLSALSPALQYWSSGGMETPYHVLSYTLLPIALLHCSIRNPKLSDYLIINSVLVLFILSRVDGFLAIPMLAVFLSFEERDTKCLKRLSMVVPATVVFLLLLAVRFYMTGAIWPNTVIAKSSLSIENLFAGIKYVYQAYTSSWISIAQSLSFLGAGILIVREYFRSTVWGKPPQLPIQFRIVVFSIALQNTFCVLVGGNWMEHYRFWIPTVLLQNCLVVYLGHYLLSRCTPGGIIKVTAPFWASALVIVAAFEQQRSDGENNLWASGIRAQSQPLSFDFISSSLAEYGQKTLLLNGSARRDTEAVLPFIRDDLPRYLRHDRALKVVSYQAGFFPFMLRKHYSTEQILFYDLVGLANLEIARLQVPKNFIGAVWGTDMQRVFSGKAGALSTFVSELNPDMIYVFGGDDEMKKFFQSIGFTVIYDRPFALVLFKASDQNLG